MAVSEEGIYRRIHNTLVKEELNLEGVTDVDMEVYSHIYLRTQAKEGMGRFGRFKKPPESAAQMGLFLPDGVMGEKLRAVGLTSSSHEWSYVSCSLYWLQMSHVAAEMSADVKVREVDGLDETEVNMALRAWGRVFAALSAKVMGYRASFMRMAVDSGVASARAALAEVELAAQVAGLESEKMAETRIEYKRAYLKATMKQEAASAAAAKRAASTAESESSARI